MSEAVLAGAGGVFTPTQSCLSGRKGAVAQSYGLKVGEVNIYLLHSLPTSVFRATFLRDAQLPTGMKTS